MDSSSGAETNENLKMILFLRALVQEKSSQGVIRRAVMGLKQIFELPRASLVISRPDDVKAHVVADVDGDIQHYEISAEDYPELRELHETREPVFIRDVFSDPRLARVLDKLRTASSPGKSVLLLPLRFDDSLFGALVLRSDDHSLDDSHEAINFGRLLATCIATAISHTLEKDLLLEEANFLRAQHQKDLVEIETLKQFAEFFDLARDGFVVTDSSGWIRYANSSAEGMLSLEKEDSESIKMMALLESGSRDFLFQLLSGKIEASSAEYFDLHVQANQRILSATARVFDPQGVWMIGFRDVTHVRLMDEDFRKTKDFLENVIENSVDAIVASDTKGRIILFNRAAETILEYSASEVIAELTSVQLYEPGVAYRIMNQLRSFQFGGKGRLETTRQRILSKSGE
ncbi:MAG: PAS domain-containing protein, partial [Myxococcota bacterium]|nr:PAS domain-containing protein [Myxococcota bacterium]